jgi:hypothetical protein
MIAERGATRKPDFRGAAFCSFLKDADAAGCSDRPNGFWVSQRDKMRPKRASRTILVR